MASNLKYAAALVAHDATTIAAYAGDASLIRLYSGTQPATADTAISDQILLAQVTCPTPLVASWLAGAATFGTFIDGVGYGNALGGTTATWFRWVRQDGITPVMDGSVGVSGCDIDLDKTNIASGQAVSITSFVLHADGTITVSGTVTQQVVITMEPLPSPATSTSSVWFPTVAEIIDEAAERARIDAGTLTPAQQYSARRSLNAIFTSWQNKDIRLSLVQEQAQLPLSIGVYNYPLPDDLFDILEASLRRDGVDIPMRNISRDEYLRIPNKTNRGRPDRYYVQLVSDVHLWIWQAPDRAGDVIVYNYFRIPKDIRADMTNTPDMARLWFDALFDELAVRLYQKFGATNQLDKNGNPVSRFDVNYFKILKANAMESFADAYGADRTWTNTTISVRFGR